MYEQIETSHVWEQNRTYYVLFSILKCLNIIRNDYRLICFNIFHTF
jgi:hypothetical protein